MLERLRQALPVAAGLMLFVIALEVLRVELRAVSWDDLRSGALALPPRRLALAIALTVVNYAVLTCYDLIAFAYIGKPLARLKVAIASFLAYAVANNVGFAMLSGASVRYRFYSRWGVTGEELSRIVFSYSVTFWLGLFALGGLSLAVTSWPDAGDLPPQAVVVTVGWLLTMMPVGYVLMTALRQRPVRLWGLELPMPRPRIAVTQLALSSVDWALAGAVLYALLPPSSLTFLGFIALFFIAILLGLASHVPGGIGVFETLMVLLLRPYLTSGQIVPALLVYRVIYYLAPLAIALAGLLVDEARQRREHAARVGELLGRFTERVTPRVLAALTFLAGVVLLISGATPSGRGRLAFLDRILPLGVIEVSHFLGSVAGAALLVLSQGLSRRLDIAYYLTTGLIAIGITASLLKGFDYEEASLLLIVLVVLWRAGPAFDRHAALFETRLSPVWVASVVGAVAASVWLGLFAFKHVEYSNELWWQFELHSDASRFLRASVGAAVVLLLFGFSRLIRQAPHETALPSEADLADAARAMSAGTSTFPHLVFLGDKAVLFDGGRSAFIMYGVQGRTWVALGDPVGPADRLHGVLRQFLERCDDFGGVPVFYEVTPSHLHRYADFGLTFVKLGEEARVDLTTFTLAGAPGAKFRKVLRRLERDGGVFRVIAPAGVPAVVEALRAVSDDWLAAKAAAEKGFSLGFFDEAYLMRFPVAVIERGGRIQAFANLWQGPHGVELSVDLMRHHRDAPRDVMEALFVHLIQWGKEQGYQRFSLGMAPLSGFEQSPVAPFWNRIGTFLYEHGESAYNFHGIRAYKEKFDPVWEPRYLAYPRGPRLPLVLADVSALVAGGYRRIFFK